MDPATRDKLRGRLDEYHRAILEDDQDHLSWDQYGMILLDFGAYTKGKNAILKALKLDPKNSNYWNNIGLAYDKLRKTELAIRLYEIALKLNPRNYYPLHNLSLHYYQNGNEMQAIAIWKQLIKEHPYDFHPFAYLAKYYYEQNEFPKVKEVLEQTQERRQRDKAALWFIAEKYYLIGEYQLAKEILIDLYRLDQKFYKIPYTLALIFSNENRLQEALYYLEQTLKLRPFDYELYFKKIRIMAKLRHSDFIPELRNAIQVNPIVAKQTLDDDSFRKYHNNSKYQEVISLARDRYQYLSKPIFLLESEFSSHPILKRMNYHLSLAIVYHYLKLLGFSRITFIYNGLGYIDESCLKHCYPEYFKQEIIQEVSPANANIMTQLPILTYHNNGLIISNKEFYRKIMDDSVKDHLDQYKITYTLKEDIFRLNSNHFSLSEEYYQEILYEAMDIVSKYGIRNLAHLLEHSTLPD
ncbi:MAG: tetratricopeptide repeat protein [Candidatus Heimdallarchaeota archaeon]